MIRDPFYRHLQFQWICGNGLKGFEGFHKDEGSAMQKKIAKKFSHKLQ